MPPPPPFGATPASFAATPPPSQQYGFTAPPAPPPGPPGGSSWPPPPPPGGTPPGQKPKGGSKGPLIAIGALVGVLLLTLAAIGIFFLVKSDDKKAGPTMPTASTSKTPERSTTTRTRTTTEPTPTEDPGSFQAKLMALIPDGYPTSVCEAASPPSPGALATIDCKKSVQPGGPEAARYSIFADKDQLILHFNESLKEDDEVQRCPGADADSPIDWNFKAKPDVVAGQVACGTYQGNADVLWMLRRFGLEQGPHSRHVLLRLGDPQQLEQPQQGSHPTGADLSALEHILREHPTIPPERGIFLPETWRLPPSICAFTSEVFYEGKLHSKSGLEQLLA